MKEFKNACLFWLRHFIEIVLGLTLTVSLAILCMFFTWFLCEVMIWFFPDFEELKLWS